MLVTFEPGVFLREELLEVASFQLVRNHADVLNKAILVNGRSGHFSITFVSGKEAMLLVEAWVLYKIAQNLRCLSHFLL